MQPTRDLWQCSKELSEGKGLHTRNEGLFFFCRLHCNCVKLKCKVGTCVFFYKGINAHFPISVCAFQSSIFGIAVFMLMCIRKLALFAIWKVSSAILHPIGRKIPAWLRQSIAGAQPWLLMGCYVPSQTFSKFLGCGIGIEFARSKHLSMQRTFLFSLAHPRARAYYH